MNQNAAITATLAALIKSGVDVRDAVEAVFGAGAYENIAGMIYDMLRAKAAA